VARYRNELNKEQKHREVFMNEGEFYVGIDLGSVEHEVAIRKSNNKECEEIKISQSQIGFTKLVKLIQRKSSEWNKRPIIGIEGENGLASPLDQILVSQGWEVYNVNSIKVDRFRDLCGAPYKTDKYDANLITRLLEIRRIVKEKGNSGLQLISTKNRQREELKLLSRYQQHLIEDLVRYSNRFKQQLRGYFPEIFLLAKDVTCQWVIDLILSGLTIEELKGWNITDFRSLKGVGIKRAVRLHNVMKDIEFFGNGDKAKAFILQQVAAKISGLKNEIEKLDSRLEKAGKDDMMVRWMMKQTGIGTRTASRIIGEIGRGKRFSKESQLAIYSGIACLDKSSGKKKLARKGIRINRVLKRAMLDWAHSKSMYCPKSRIYYLKKINEGKGHIHALKCLARQLVRVLFKELERLDECNLAMAA